MPPLSQEHAQAVAPRHRSETRNGSPLLSVITPAYNEARNLPLLYERLSKVLSTAGVAWEWIVIDDHSTDETFAIASNLARVDSKAHVIRFSRNFGSHTAVTCGLDYPQGDCAVIMAADLQDPPETLPDLLAKWHAGAQVVWAVRAHHEGESPALSRWIYP